MVRQLYMTRTLSIYFEIFCFKNLAQVHSIFVKVKKSFGLPSVFLFTNGKAVRGVVWRCVRSRDGEQKQKANGFGDRKSLELQPFPF